MRLVTAALFAAAQAVLTAPAPAQTISFGFSNGPFGLSIGPARACITQVVPAGGPVRVSLGMQVISVQCANLGCTEQRVRICPIRR